MRRTMTQKIICLTVSILFLINDIAFGLGTMPGSTQPGTKDAMYALGQKLFATKHGPGGIDFGAIDWEEYAPSKFQGEIPDLSGILSDHVDGNDLLRMLAKSSFFSNMDSMWDSEKKGVDLIKAANYWRRTEARIPDEILTIKEGVWNVEREEDGALGIARRGPREEGGYVIIIHSDFVKRWNHILKNDKWFKVKLDGEVRYVSIAWSIFFRLMKHEMTDLAKKNLIPKGSISYITAYFQGEGTDPVIEALYGGNPDEKEQAELSANKISGRFASINDAMWMWFLGSYCFNNHTRYDNDTLRKRLEWFFNDDDKDVDTEKLKKEFPNLLQDASKIEAAIKFALFINHAFFGENLAAFKRKEELSPGELVGMLRGSDPAESLFAAETLWSSPQLRRVLSKKDEARAAGILFSAAIAGTSGAGRADKPVAGTPDDKDDTAKSVDELFLEAHGFISKDPSPAKSVFAEMRDRSMWVPMLSFGGIRLFNDATGNKYTVKDVACDPGKQFEVVSFMEHEFGLKIISFPMDLSYVPEAVSIANRDVGALPITSVFQEKHVDQSGVLFGANFEFTRENVEKLKLPDVLRHGRMHVFIEAMKKAKNEFGKRSVKVGFAIGPWTLATRLLGTEDALYAQKDDPELLALLLDYCKKVSILEAEALADAGADTIIILEPQTAVLTPSYYKKIIIESVNAVAAAIHRKGLPVIFHGCGDSTPFLDQMPQLNVDAFSIDEMVDFNKAYQELTRNGAFLIGNIVASQIISKIPEEVREEARAVLARMADMPNLLMGLTCEMPFDAHTAANIEAIKSALSEDGARREHERGIIQLPAMTMDDGRTDRLEETHREPGSHGKLSAPDASAGWTARGETTPSGKGAEEPLGLVVARVLEELKPADVVPSDHPNTSQPPDQAERLRELMAIHNSARASEIAEGKIHNPAPGLENGPSDAAQSTGPADQAQKLREAVREAGALQARHEANTEALEDYPLIRIFSEYILPVGLDKGPASTRLSVPDLRNIYGSINVLNNSHMEIFWPQRHGLTKEVLDAVKDIGKRKDKQNVSPREYNFANLIAMLQSSDNEASKIIVTDIPLGEEGQNTRDEMAELIRKDPESFKNVRFFNMNMPETFAGSNATKKKTVFQADAIIKAMLARLYEPGKTPFVEALLGKLLEGTINCSTADFLKTLTTAGDATGLDLSNEDDLNIFIHRINLAFGHVVKIAEEIGRRLILDKNFWIAA